jgi:hypothetical protein
MDTFIDAVAQIAGSPAAAVSAAVHEMLDLPRTQAAAGAERRPGSDVPRPVRSSLNNDGSPLQACVTSSPSALRTRLVCDPAATGESPAAGFRLARRALRRVLPQRATAEVAELCESTLRLLLPTSQEELNRLDNGTLWLGIGLGTPGIALYTSGRYGDPRERWAAAGRWLTTIARHPRIAERLVSHLSEDMKLASAALEGADGASARGKLYFRLRRPAPLSALRIEGMSAPAMNRFLRTFAGDQTILLNGLVVSVGVGLMTGELADVKVDLCGHCIRLSPSEWARRVADFCAAAGVRPPPIEDALVSGAAEPAFIGFGLDRHAEPRLNTYLKARA